MAIAAEAPHAENGTTSVPKQSLGTRTNSAAFKVVPETRQMRDRVRAEAARFAATLDRSRPFARSELQKMGEDLLRQMDLGEQYLGFSMVCIANEFWREQVQAVPFQRRLLLLPH